MGLLDLVDIFEIVFFLLDCKERSAKQSPVYNSYICVAYLCLILFTKVIEN